jgi:hypothetical protein
MFANLGTSLGRNCFDTGKLFFQIVYIFLIISCKGEIGVLEDTIRKRHLIVYTIITKRSKSF